MTSRLLAAVALLTAAVTQSPATADDVGEPARYARFIGTASPYTGGTSSACYEIIPANPVVAARPCTATFEITASGGVCDVDAGELAGWFHYRSHTTGVSFVNFPLTAANAGGAAYIYGELVEQTRVLHVRITTAALCDETATGPFEGYLAYV